MRSKKREEIGSPSRSQTSAMQATRDSRQDQVLSLRFESQPLLSNVRTMNVWSVETVHKNDPATDCVEEGRAVRNKNEWQVSPENLLLHDVFSWHFRQPTAKGFFFSYTGKSVKTLLSKQPNLTKCLIS